MAQIIWEGTPQLRRALLEAAIVAPEALAAAGFEEMEEVMAEAKELVPVDMGVLRDSGHVLPPERSAGGVEIVAGFGGAASDYAIVQHERLDYNHKTGGPKFLERPFISRSPEMMTNMAMAARAALQRLGI